MGRGLPGWLPSQNTLIGVSKHVRQNVFLGPWEKLTRPISSKTFLPFLTWKSGEDLLSLSAYAMYSFYYHINLKEI